MPITIGTPAPVVIPATDVTNNTFWQITGGFGAWNGSAWTSAPIDGRISLIPIGTWADGITPSIIRITTEAINSGSTKTTINIEDTASNNIGSVNNVTVPTNPGVVIDVSLTFVGNDIGGLFFFGDQPFEDYLITKIEIV